jgi:hypothetical protein
VEKCCIVGQATDDCVTHVHICIACWISKATNTHSVYIILFALQWQQWLHQCTLMSCYMYIAFLVEIHVVKQSNTLLNTVFQCSTLLSVLKACNAHQGSVVVMVYPLMCAVTVRVELVPLHWNSLHIIVVNIIYILICSDDWRSVSVMQKV